MRRFTLALCCLLLGWTRLSIAQDLPPELAGWQSWVLDGRSEVACPFIEGGGPTFSHRVCVWPGVLELRVDGDGLQFTQRVRIYAKGWLALPGDDDSWPQDVTANGTRVPVLLRSSQPAVELLPGEHTLDGAARRACSARVRRIRPSHDRRSFGRGSGAGWRQRKARRHASCHRSQPARCPGSSQAHGFAARNTAHADPAARRRRAARDGDRSVAAGRLHAVAAQGGAARTARLRRSPARPAASRLVVA